MKEILLTQGKVALVSDCDFEELNKFKWYAANPNGHTFYAIRHSTTGKHTTIRMHRELFGAGCEGKTVDHINHNGLDNRRENLRLCSHTQNCHNRRVDFRSKPKSSRFKGVRFHRGKWEARICNNRERIYLGHFDSEEEAARAYDVAAIEVHGEFAHLNFPPQ